MIYVTMRHVRKAGMCSRGVRDFVTSKGYSWDEFLRVGAPLDLVRTVDDAMVQKVADIAEAEAQDGQQ